MDKMTITAILIPEQTPTGEPILNSISRHLLLGVHLATRFDLTTASPLRTALNRVRDSLFGEYVNRENKKLPPSENQYFIRPEYVRELMTKEGQLSSVVEFDIEIPDDPDFQEKYRGYSTIYTSSNVVGIRVYGPKVVDPKKAHQTWAEYDWGQIPKSKAAVNNVNVDDIVNVKVVNE